MDHDLDVSDLEPPEPLEEVLDALSGLPEGDRLRVILHREPFPLYGFLRRLGYGWRTHAADGHYEILIWPLSEEGKLPRKSIGP